MAKPIPVPPPSEAPCYLSDDGVQQALPFGTALHEHFVPDAGGGTWYPVVDWKRRPDWKRLPFCSNPDRCRRGVFLTVADYQAILADLFRLRAQAG
jgi:hypothetical protein